MERKREAFWVTVILLVMAGLAAGGVLLLQRLAGSWGRTAEILVVIGLVSIAAYKATEWLEFLGIATTGLAVSAAIAAAVLLTPVRCSASSAIGEAKLACDSLLPAKTPVVGFFANHAVVGPEGGEGVILAGVLPGVVAGAGAAIVLRALHLASRPFRPKTPDGEPDRAA